MLSPPSLHASVLALGPASASAVKARVKVSVIVTVQLSALICALMSVLEERCGLIDGERDVLVVATVDVGMNSTQAPPTPQDCSRRLR